MVLVIGGAYQGKLDYVLENYPGRTVFKCSADDPEIDTTADVIDALHLAALARIRKGSDTLGYLDEILPKLSSKIVICDDISCGVVPIDNETRKWRETTGRAMTKLSKSADVVIRVFCGIGSRIK